MKSHRLKGIFNGTITLLFGIFVLGKVFDFIDISWGKFILGIVGLYIIFEGIRHIVDSKQSKDNSDNWEKYDPGYMPPPPPPPNFNEGDVDASLNKKYWSEQVSPNTNPENIYGKAEQKNGYGYEQQGKDYKNSSYSEYDKIYKSSFIGDFKYKDAYWQLKPMELSAFIGDAHLDLTKAQIPFGETKIQFSAFIGDMKVFVPNDPSIGVKVNLNSFIGETKFMKEHEGGILANHQLQTPLYDECERRISISVSSFIGDVKVKRIG